MPDLITLRKRYCKVIDVLWEGKSLLGIRSRETER